MDQSSMVATRAREQAGCSWSCDELSALLDGPEGRARQQAAFRVVEKDAVLQATGLDQFEMGGPERREQSTRRLMRFSELLRGKSEEEELALVRAMSLVDSGMTIRWFVQRLLWIETLRNQGSPEQIALWTNGAREFALVGCFGMTEIGSSSYLRGAETEAEYQHATRSFRINSPTVTATKIWIGMAGQIATHCIVFANLKVSGKPAGIQLFIVQIRDQRTGIPMPGVEVGDMGPKMGLDGNDNGFIRFSNVVVPVSHMLCRWAHVDENGNFFEAPLAALAYGSTIAERLVNYYLTDYLALNAGVKWCLLRRQGPPVNGLQPQIMDYPSHYTKIMPYLSFLYVARSLSKQNLLRYQSMVADLRSGNETSYLSQLAEMHALACAQKSFGSWSSMDMYEALRRLMGGHAFHQYMGIGRFQADSAVSTTGGGDNNVLVKQTGLYLTKLTKEKKSQSGEFLFETFKPTSLLTSMDDLNAVLAVFSIRAQVAVARARETKAVLDIVAAAENWHWRLLLSASLTQITQERMDSEAPLVVMWKLVAVDRLLKIFAECVLDTSVAAASLYEFQKIHERLSWRVRLNSYNLVEAFGLPDAMLRNPLIQKNGGYEAYLDAMRNNRFNKNKVAPYWKELVQPKQRPENFEEKK